MATVGDFIVRKQDICILSIDNR